MEVILARDVLVARRTLELFAELTTRDAVCISDAARGAFFKVMRKLSACDTTDWTETEITLRDMFMRVATLRDMYACEEYLRRLPFSCDDVEAMTKKQWVDTSKTCSINLESHPAAYTKNIITKKLLSGVISVSDFKISNGKYIILNLNHSKTFYRYNVEESRGFPLEWYDTYICNVEITAPSNIGICAIETRNCTYEAIPDAAGKYSNKFKIKLSMIESITHSTHHMRVVLVFDTVPYTGVALSVKMSQIYFPDNFAMAVADATMHFMKICGVQIVQIKRKSTYDRYAGEDNDSDEDDLAIENELMGVEVIYNDNYRKPEKPGNSLLFNYKNRYTALYNEDTYKAACSSRVLVRQSSLVRAVLKKPLSEWSIDANMEIRDSHRNSHSFHYRHMFRRHYTKFGITGLPIASDKKMDYIEKPLDVEKSIRRLRKILISCSNNASIAIRNRIETMTKLTDVPRLTYAESKHLLDGIMLSKYGIDVAQYDSDDIWRDIASDIIRNMNKEHDTPTLEAGADTPTPETSDTQIMIKDRNGFSHTLHARDLKEQQRAIEKFITECITFDYKHAERYEIIMYKAVVQTCGIYGNVLKNTPLVLEKVAELSVYFAKGASCINRCYIDLHKIKEKISMLTESSHDVKSEKKALTKMSELLIYLCTTLQIIELQICKLVMYAAELEIDNTFAEKYLINMTPELEKQIKEYYSSVRRDGSVSRATRRLLVLADTSLCRELTAGCSSLASSIRASLLDESAESGASKVAAPETSKSSLSISIRGELVAPDVSDTLLDALGPDGIARLAPAFTCVDDERASALATGKRVGLSISIIHDAEASMRAAGFSLDPLYSEYSVSVARGLISFRRSSVPAMIAGSVDTTGCFSLLDADKNFGPPELI
jgi:hypothetical protein